MAGSELGDRLCINDSSIKGNPHSYQKQLAKNDESFLLANFSKRKILKDTIDETICETDMGFANGDSNHASETQNISQDVEDKTEHVTLQSTASDSRSSVTVVIGPNAVSTLSSSENIDRIPKQSDIQSKVSESTDSIVIKHTGRGDDVNDAEEDTTEDEKGSLDKLPGPPSAKDRGYAWIVLFNVFLVSMLSDGYVRSFGIIYTLIMDYFPESSASSSGMIMGVFIGTRALLAPVMGALTVIFGPRKCIVTGALLCAAGILMAVPCFSILYLIFMLGVVVGAGICLIDTPGFLLVTDYFQEKRSLANGIRASGNPIGGVIFAPLVVLFHQEFALRGSFILIAGIMMQLAVIGMLLRSFELQEKIVQGDYWKKIQRENGLTNEQMKDLKTNIVSRQVSKKKKPIDFTYLKNPSYLIYLFLGMCTALAIPNALLYAPVYGRSIGLSDLENSAITSYMSVCDVFMRLLCGIIFNKKNINKNYGLIGCLVIGGIGCMSVPLSTNMWHLIFFATTFSLCMACYWTLIIVLLADQFGGDSMSSTYGFFRMCKGVCGLFYPSIIGFVLDISGGMSVPYLWMGFMLILGAVIFASQPLVARFSVSKVNAS